MFTVKDIAEKFSVTEATVREWVKKKKIPVVFLPGGNMRFDKEKIEEWTKKRSFTARAY